MRSRISGGREHGIVVYVIAVGLDARSGVKKNPSRAVFKTLQPERWSVAENWCDSLSGSHGEMYPAVRKAVGRTWDKTYHKRTRLGIYSVQPTEHNGSFPE